MEPDRPDPDALLATLEPPSPDRGLLKVFLGYAAGVGKTFAMLQAATSALNQGRDVVTGWVEPHNRPETTLQLAGLEGVAPRSLTHGTLQLWELDLDACLARRPQVVLVDELAHTNAPGSRHEKRWQDVEELRDAGIEVWTTLNIQHLDSMNDVVARITGVLVQETVPDKIFDSAQEVEVVDVDPEDLIDRLSQGKIYGPDQAPRALGGFFKKDNLLVLRELTLRRAADRVGREVDSARTQAHVQKIWPVRERLMVSVGPSPLSEDLLRHAARLARNLGAQLLAVVIETPGLRVLSPAAQAQLAKNLNVAESLGAETVVLRGEEVARDLVAYARYRNVTKLVLGKNRGHLSWRFWRRTIGDELLRLSGDIDVYVLSGRNPPPVKSKNREASGALPWKEFGWSTLILGLFTALGVVFESWGMVEANLILTLLLGVVVSAGFFGWAASVFSSVLAVFAFNFFFTEPKYSLSVANPQYYLVFLFLLVVGAVIGILTQRLRRGVVASREREQRMESLNRMHKELAGLVDAEGICTVASGLVGEILGRRARVLQPDAQGNWPQGEGYDSQESALFSWVLGHGQKAGRGTSTLREQRLSVWPLAGARKALGVLVVEPVAPGVREAPGQDELIESLTASLASALERVDLIAEAKAQALAVETERTRNALLHSLSHDLRTPLTIIAGSIETLEASTSSRLAPGESSLLATVGRETRWLARQVENLLHLSRLTEVGVPWTLEWVPAEDPVLSAVGRLRSLHPGWTIALKVPPSLPLLKIEPSLVEQALVNYLENANDYAGGAGVLVEVLLQDRQVEYRVLDRGPGVAEGERAAIFGKFTRGEAAKTSPNRGTGLGLAIVREVARVNGGQAGVESRPGGGSVFFLKIPVPDDQP